MVDNKSGYLGVVPLNSKAQFDLLTKELVAFCALLGYNEVELRSDNEPTIVQVAKLTQKARQQMGLITHMSTPAAYTHGNGLAENALSRVRGVACSLMFNVMDKLKVTFGTSHALWTWAMRHAALLMNRYSPYKGLTSYEIVFGKPYDGQICEFSEPVFGFSKSHMKGNAKWHRMIFLGKVECQDSFLLYDGSSLVLTRSVRRVNTDWRMYMKFHLQFNLFSWQYKVGFGGRVVPTKRRVAGPRAGSFAAPQGPTVPSALVDEDAEAVKQKAAEEKKEEAETSAMAGHDKPTHVSRDVEFADETVFNEDMAKHPAPSTPAPELPAVAMGSADTAMPDDPGLAAPVTPVDVTNIGGTMSPRHVSTTRAHERETEEELNAKKARVADSKKQRINAITSQHAQMIRMVKFGTEEYYTMDSYDSDLKQDEFHDDDNDLWAGEEEVLVAGVPEALWHDSSLDERPPTPEQWVEDLADKVEISRLLDMGVLKRFTDYDGEISGCLTTRFVRDWRQKLYIGEGDSRMRWMRRSRYVAREFANEKRDDVFAPTTGAHSNNLLLASFLQMADAAKDGCVSYKPLLASMDIGDAFLQVDQEHPVKCELQGCEYVILKNLPGQRLGARSWYWYFRNYLEKFQYEFCDVQPCLGRTKDSVILIHVDDILYTGSAEFFEKQLLPVCQERFSVKWSALQEHGSTITFLKKKISLVTNGLMVVPGTQVHKVVEVFENHFGAVRGQLIPCDASIQLEDVSAELTSTDAAVFRRVVGMCLYLSRDRPDIIFPVKEVSGKMSRPTLTSLQHLRKLIGYLKKMGALGILLQYPQPGVGKWRTSTEKYWILESYSDADWASNKAHRKSTSCGVHLLNGCFLFASSRTQRVISLSSCESELYSIVSTMSDAIFIRRCLEFVASRNLSGSLYR